MGLVIDMGEDGSAMLARLTGSSFTDSVLGFAGVDVATASVTLLVEATGLTVSETNGMKLISECERKREAEREMHQ